MLINRRSFWKLHGRWFACTLALAVAATAWMLAAGQNLGRWPGGGSWPGLALGTAAGLIFLFEAALVFKKTKWLRTARWTLSAQTWMQAHIWLGLLSVPLVALHCGLRLGGTLSTIFVAVLAAVIASGLWGLVLQNVLPRLLLEAAPAETIYSQIDNVGRQYAAEARRAVLLACGGDDELPVRAEPEPALAQSVHGAARVVGPQVKRSPQPTGELRTVVDSPAIRTALAESIEPFLSTGVGPQGILGTRQRNQWFFDDLRLRAPPELRDLVGQLEDLCERRRQLNVQRRLHFWLHNWLWVHLPLSAALLALLVGHAVLALRFQ